MLKTFFHHIAFVGRKHPETKAAKIKLALRNKLTSLCSKENGKEKKGEENFIKLT